MRDLRIIASDEEFDFSFGDTDIETVDDLSSSVLASLYTDTGYWGDIFSNFPQDVSGSELYKFERSKLTDEQIESVREATANALNWMVTDGIASSVDVSSERLSNGASLLISIYRPLDRENVFTILWDDHLNFQGFELSS